MTQIFVTRAELLPPGETTEDHRKLQQDEVEIVEKDKKSNGSHRGGLFRGCFENSLGRPNGPPIRDLEDGVDRCPRCAWELEDGVCHSCGLHASETYPWSGSESPGLSYFTGDEITHPHLMDEEGEHFDSLTASGSDGSPFGDIEHSDDSESFARQPNGTDLGTARAVTREQMEARHVRNARNARPNTHDLENRYSPAPSYPDISTEDELRDTDDYSAEDDDEVGSLDDFVVNDMEEIPSSVRNSPHSFQYDTDEITSIVDNSGPYSSDDNATHREESDGFLDRQRPENRLSYLADDSDESPVQHRRRSFHPRSRDSSRISSSGEPDSTDSGIPRRPGVTARIARRQANRRLQENRSSALNHPTAEELEPNSGERRGVPIKIESDSDSPLPARRSRRRRGAKNHVLSDEDDDVDAASVNDNPVQSRQSSSGTATVGRKSPSQAAVRGRNTQKINQAPGVSLPIVINSSPTRPEASSFGWYPYHASTESLDNSLQTPHLREALSPSIRNRLRPYARRYQRDPSRSPLPPNIQSSTSRVRPPIFARSIRDQSQSETNEAHQQVERARATRRADRQALKQQKRRREREQATLDSGATRPPASTDGSDMMNIEGGVRFGDRRREQQTYGTIL